MYVGLAHVQSGPFCSVGVSTCPQKIHRCACQQPCLTISIWVSSHSVDEICNPHGPNPQMERIPGFFGFLHHFAPLKSQLVLFISCLVRQIPVGEILISCPWNSLSGWKNSLHVAYLNLRIKKTQSNHTVSFVNHHIPVQNKNSSFPFEVKLNHPSFVWVQSPWNPQVNWWSPGLVPMTLSAPATLATWATWVMPNVPPVPSANAWNSSFGSVCVCVCIDIYIYIYSVYIYREREKERKSYI